MSERDNAVSIEQSASSFLALLPFFVFIMLYIGTGLYFTLMGTERAFYQLPAPVAALPAIMLAFILSKDGLNRTMDTFFAGVGQSNVVAMCLVFLLAGAFSSVTQSVGAVDSSVNLSLQLIPAHLILPGLFVIAALLSIAMGTSVGTIAALAPIAYGIANTADIYMPLMAGTIMSGAMFGDNLSFISDTTIAATRTQHVDMQDKFKENFRIAMPAALLTLVIYGIVGQQHHTIATTETQALLPCLPYLSIFLLALLGINVFAVLIIGICLAGGIGLFSMPDYNLSLLFQDIMHGFSNVQEVFLLSMFLGGLGFLIEKQGGLNYVQHQIQAAIRRLNAKQCPQKASFLTEIAIALLVSLTNIFTANNTIAIVVVGKIARELSVRQKLIARRVASLLDVFSCVVQGLIPYGMQALLLGSIFHISPLYLSSHAFYPLVLAVTAVIAMCTFKHRTYAE